ncbi:hypothetical protein FXO38_26622 [Capsicum annuum]|uniref:TLC domain-containing protein n=1 Tax=Capsicum annuum TaxID=4072 RepID=A0A2G2ZSC0_CAPAN|nr:hypothetical protein FXO38_26622 [Capsicum annuum]PHT84857.1 hypothetical protein T459_13300 [Capsicum annuum]
MEDNQLPSFIKSGIYQLNSTAVFIDPVQILNRSYTRLRVLPSTYYSRFFDSTTSTQSPKASEDSRKRKRKQKKKKKKTVQSLNEREQIADRRHQMRALAVSVGYLIYDLVCCLFDKQVKIDNLIHHLVSAIGLGAGLAYEWMAADQRDEVEADIEAAACCVYIDKGDGAGRTCDIYRSICNNCWYYSFFRLLNCEASGCVLLCHISYSRRFMYIHGLLVHDLGLPLASCCNQHRDGSSTSVA